MWDWSALSHIACGSHLGYYSTIHLCLEIIWQASIPYCPAAQIPFPTTFKDPLVNELKVLPQPASLWVTGHTLHLVCSHAVLAQKVCSAGAGWNCLKQLEETVRKKADKKGRGRWKFLLLSYSSISRWGKPIHWTLMAVSILLPAQQKDEQL